jgi:hypothetical protein
MFNLTGYELSLIFLVFFLGGVLKGMLGIGLALLVISILGAFLSPALVVALLVMPIVTSNFWQAFRHGLPAGSIRRLLPMSLVFVLFTSLGAMLLTSIEANPLFVSLGVIVVSFSLLNLLGLKLIVPPHHEVWAGPFIGVVAGLMNGISTINGPPLVMYLVGIQLTKDDLVKAFGLVTLFGSVPLALSYIRVGLFGLHEFFISSMTIAPVFLGLWAGQIIRNHIDKELFRKVLLIALVLLGANLIRRGLF